MHERARGFDDGEPERSRAGERALGRPVRRDHDGAGFDLRDVAGRDDPLLGEGVQHGGVVHQVAEDGERPRLGVLEGQGNSVTNAEAHAKVGGPKDPHNFTMQSIRRSRGMSSVSRVGSLAHLDTLNEPCHDPRSFILIS